LYSFFNIQALTLNIASSWDATMCYTDDRGNSILWNVAKLLLVYTALPSQQINLLNPRFPLGVTPSLWRCNTRKYWTLIHWGINGILPPQVHPGATLLYC
jgi:hypothetical protein